MLICRNHFNKIRLFRNWFSHNIDQPQQLANTKSIKPSQNDGYAYGYYFPEHWTMKEIYTSLDPFKKHIENVRVVENKTGQPTGKLLFKFYSEEKMKQIIERFNEEYITSNAESYKIVIKPFSLKEKEKKESQKLRYGVRVSNLDYDISYEELKKLAKDFGENVVEMNLRQNGLNKGFGSVYFNNIEQSISFKNFTDGLEYRDRKISSHLMKQSYKKQKQDSFLQVPIYIFSANVELMRRQVLKQSL